MLQSSERIASVDYGYFVNYIKNPRHITATIAGELTMLDAVRAPPTITNGSNDNE